MTKNALHRKNRSYMIGYTWVIFAFGFNPKRGAGMDAKELKMMLAGIGLAGLLAGASLTAAPAEAQTGSG
jgi:radical SAM modification target selenobiotic family peptide